MSGIAATLLSLGTICHKRFGVPVPYTKESSLKQKLNLNESKLIKMAKILIIDEVSMMDYKVLDLIKRCGVQEHLLCQHSSSSVTTERISRHTHSQRT